MVVKEISVSRSVRVNTGNYEGTEHFVSMRAELDELDDEAEAADELSRQVDGAMLRQLHRSYKVRGKRDMTPAQISKHHGIRYKEE